MGNQGYRFGSSARLKRRADISECRDRGTKIYCKHFLLLVLPSPTPESRLAVAVTTKIEKRSVGRNKIKRRLRELFRVIRSQFIEPVDILIVARRDVQSCSFDEYKRQIVGALIARKIMRRGGAILPHGRTSVEQSLPSKE